MWRHLLLKLPVAASTCLVVANVVVTISARDTAVHYGTKDYKHVQQIQTEGGFVSQYEPVGDESVSG